MTNSVWLTCSRTGTLRWEH